MQRITCITQRPALLSTGIRHNSTDVPSKPTWTLKRTVRIPMVRLGDVVIPSAEEIRAKASAKLKPSYAADISYLDNASNSYLSAKLARLGRETIKEEIIKKEETFEKKSVPDEVPRPTPTPVDVTALAARRRETRPTPTPVDLTALAARRRETRPTPTPVDLTALAAKRRETRAESVYQHLLNYVPVPEKSKFLRSEFEKSNIFASPERTLRTRRRIPPRRSPQLQGAEREQKGPKPQRNERPQNERPQKKRRAPVAPTTKRVTPSIEGDGIDETVFQPGGHEPEFNGPERLSSDLLEHFGPSFNVTVVAQSGTAIKIPISKVDSFYKSNYSPYVTPSKEDYASPPDVLGAVKVAERALSHQRHYSLTARDTTLELVAQSSTPIAKPST